MVSALYTARPQDQLRLQWIQRMDARYWQLSVQDETRAVLIAPQPDQLYLRAQTRRCDELVRLVWDSQDQNSHIMLRQKAMQDYRGLLWSMRWQGRGPWATLGSVYGAYLCIDGRDAQGVAQHWRVPLRNYLHGTMEDARLTLDFDALSDAQNQPIWAGDIDSIALELALQGHNGQSAWQSAAQTAELWLSDMFVDGALARVHRGDAFLPRHAHRLYLDYDALRCRTPATIVESIEALGYSQPILLDIGQQYFTNRQAQSDLIDFDGAPLHSCTEIWVRDFLMRAQAIGLQVMMVVGGILPADAVPAALCQQSPSGTYYVDGQSADRVALSWHTPRIWDWLQRLADKLLRLHQAAGYVPHLYLRDMGWQVDADNQPMLAAADLRAAYAQATGQSAPALQPLGAALDVAQKAYLNWCQQIWDKNFATLQLVGPNNMDRPQLSLLADATTLSAARFAFCWPASLWDAMRHISLRIDARASLSSGGLARLRGARAGRAVDISAVVMCDGARSWPAIWADMDALAHLHIPAGLGGYDAICRAGAVLMQMGAQGEAEVQVFEDEIFPLDVAQGFHLAPEYQTQVVRTASGHEQRNAMWAHALARYDAAAGVRSFEDVQTLLRFFHARQGRAVAFRLFDPLDHSSSADGSSAPAAQDQILGLGDGRRTQFALVKSYQPQGKPRAILLPRFESLQVAIDGQVQSAQAYQLQRPGGMLLFKEPPAVGAVVSAGFLFDVPVRFEEDRIDLELQAWRAGHIAAVPMVEVRAI